MHITLLPCFILGKAAFLTLEKYKKILTLQKYKTSSNCALMYTRKMLASLSKYSVLLHNSTTTCVICLLSVLLFKLRSNHVCYHCMSLDV